MSDVRRARSIKKAPRRAAGSLADSISVILGDYVHVKESEPFSKTSSIWAAFEHAAQMLREAAPVKAASSLRVKWSAGQGRWANVPWIAVLDDRETRRTSEGIYVILLFRADMSGVYVTINQGASGVTAGMGVEGYEYLRRRAAKAYEAIKTGLPEDFSFLPRIDLKSDAPLVRSYLYSTITYKLYEPSSPVTDEQLQRDLSAVIAAYRRLVPSRRVLGNI